MRIAFVGAGAVGCHYGSKMIEAGSDVLLLARGQHLATLQRVGLKHESNGECSQMMVNATSDFAQIESCSIIVLSCKMTGLSNMIDLLRNHVHSDTLLLTLQNGVEAPAMLSAAFPDHAIVAGTAFIGARLEQPGHVIHSAAGGIRMGLWQQGSGEQYLPALISAFQDGAVPARLDDDPEAMLWRKLLWNCGFNAITAITRRYARDMASDAETLVIVRQAMDEVVAIANACDIAIGEQDILKHVEVTLAMGPVKTSMWQDIEGGRKTEVDYINGYVVKKADALKVPAPVNRLLMSLIHAIERA